MRASRTLGVVLAIVLLHGCGIPPKPEPAITTHDFGSASPPAAACIKVPINLQNVTAPSWLDGVAIQYRLAYADQTERRAYAHSRWAAPPASLFMLRLREHLAAANCAGDTPPLASMFQLHIELDEFNQVFDTAKSSFVTLHAGALLTRGFGRKPIARQRFTVQRDTTTADAAGAVAAFGAASDDLARQIVQWLVAENRLTSAK
ncbi:MAG: ABC-type transport auxiliary lipoprotein family protein [Burkholderiales bacterium]